jgi:hypothetical protein
MKKTTGRPPTPKSQRRNVIFRFVVTKGDAAKIRASARGLSLTLSEYMRSVAIPK